jgi:hypothetical protein
MKLFRLFIIGIFYITICNSVVANIQKDSLSEVDIPSNFIGASLSSFSCMGISYHGLIGDDNYPKSAFKFTFLITPNINSDYDIWNKVWIFIGAELHRNLYINSFSRFYVLGGIGYISDMYLFIGPGVGYEIFSGSPGIAINIDAGLSFSNKLHNSLYPGLDITNFELMPGIGLGLSYAF